MVKTAKDDLKKVLKAALAKDATDTAVKRALRHALGREAAAKAAIEEEAKTARTFCKSWLIRCGAGLVLVALTLFWLQCKEPLGSKFLAFAFDLAQHSAMAGYIADLALGLCKLGWFWIMAALLMNKFALTAEPGSQLRIGLLMLLVVVLIGLWFDLYGYRDEFSVCTTAPYFSACERVEILLRFMTSYAGSAFVLVFIVRYIRASE